MRKNEYTSLAEFRSQYVGVWAPSEGHWFGLDFRYKGTEYRLHTGTMYGIKEIVDPNGIARQFGLYKKTDKPDPKYPDINLYELLDEKESIDLLLKSCAIDGKPFSEIIMDDDTELLGQD